MMLSLMRSAVLATVCLLLPAAGFAADHSPVGTYRVVGTNPGGGSTYQGTVTVQATGDTYYVEWDVAGDKSYGFGVFYNDALSVAGVVNDEAFVFVMLPVDGGLAGRWTTAGGKKVGTEKWSPQ